ncbi:DoxX family membrane protein [Pseudomonas sp. BN414]|uniref:DoxX-like family protein n=1 Tax=Pseudomonas sp. BN414 TaxID=2567888 RepID=UPI002457BB8E|nr:DoxX-like family protein [Pseudomonas sp. BN414]MDH4568594.1 DoxX family membrane protein [Pseudomonas sp. BN414]
MPIAELRRFAMLARCGLALLFLYHGLVPKLLWLSSDERLMITAHGLTHVELVATLAGLAEIILALILLGVRQSRWPLALAALLLAGLLLDVALFTPGLLIQAFNPLSTNLVALCLCLVGWWAEAPVCSEQSLGQPD